MKSRQAKRKDLKLYYQKWSIALKVIPILILITLMKFMAHKFGWEIMELNALFTSLVAGTIFLIGFLISGVLSDYKESEKLPSELSASLTTLLDDTYTILKSKNSDTALQFIEFQKSFINSLTDWFYKKERTQTLLKKIGQMNDFFVLFENSGVQANYVFKYRNSPFKCKFIPV